MILITGATGLVGAHLALRLLERGRPVRALYRHLSSQEKTRRLFKLHGQSALFDRIQWIQGDVTDVPSLERAFQDVEQIYHCAALVSFDPKDEERLRKTNIEGTANLVNLAIDYPIKKFCHISSIAALGDLSQHETTITEETQWNPEKPHSDYAISKYGGEMEVWRAFQEGLPVVILNPGVIIGSGFETGSAQIVTSLKKGLAFYSDGCTGFVWVEDVVRSMVHAMESEIVGERFTIVAENLSYKQMLFELADALKVRRPFIRAGRSLTSIAWRIDWFLSLFGKKRVLSKDAAQSLHKTDLFSNKKSVSNLGIQYTSIAEAAKQIVELG